MKIPKYVDKLIERRMKLSLELMDVSSQLDKWLENNDNEDYKLTLRKV